MTFYTFKMLIFAAKKNNKRCKNLVITYREIGMNKLLLIISHKA